MNKIIREHYPVSRLPADLREAVGDAEKVRLTIEAEEKPSRGQEPPPGLSDWFTRHQHIRRDNFKSTEEVTEWVRELRDEWSHRER